MFISQFTSPSNQHRARPPSLVVRMCRKSIEVWQLAVNNSGSRKEIWIMYSNAFDHP